MKHNYHQISYLVLRDLQLIGFRFYHQKDMKRSSKVCRYYLVNMIKVLDILDPPSQTLNLNPIEQLWDFKSKKSKVTSKEICKPNSLMQYLKKKHFSNFSF